MSSPLKLPAAIEPMIPAAAREPFDSPRHAFEIAWDGLRALLFIEGAGVRAQDRYGRDITDLYPELGAVPELLHGSGHVLDGEIVTLDSAGKPSFALLEPRLSASAEVAEQLSTERPVVFQGFDILYLDGRRVLNEPLRTRRRMLKQVLRREGVLTVPDHVVADGVAFFEAARQHGLAGIVAKELDSPYVSGLHSRAWQVVRVSPREEFVIGGFTYGGPTRVRAGPHRSPPFHSLLIGQYDRWGQLHCAAEVSGGFTEETAEQLAVIFDDITTTVCPFSNPPAPERLVFWCEPRVAATIAFAERGRDGTLRFPKFETVRPDVPAEYCRAPETGL
jgi:ATP-dependent DNA ligase